MNFIVGRNEGLSLVEVLIAAVLIGIGATVAGFVSQNAFKSHEILKKRVDKFIVQNTILNSFDCVSTFQLIDPKICQNKATIIARDSQGQALMGQDGAGKVFEAVCSPQGVQFKIDVTQKDFSNTDPSFNYSFCGYHLSNSSGSLSVHSFYREEVSNLNKTATSCETLLHTSYYDSLSPTLYRGDVTCPKGFYAVMGGANCSAGSGLVVASLRSADPNNPNTWEATCCSADVGNTAHSVYVTCVQGKD